MNTPKTAAQESSYYTIFENSLNAIVIIDRNAVVLEANQTVGTLLGYAPKELVGRSCWDFVCKKHLAPAKKSWQSFLEYNQPHEGMVSFNHRDGKALYAEYRIVSTDTDRNRYAFMLRDITARRHIEHKLQHSEARYQRLTSIYPVGIFHTDTLGRDLYINEKAEQIMDITFDGAMGFGWEKNLHPEDAALVKNTWYNSVRTGKNINLEYRFLHHDDTVVWVKAESEPERDAKGQIIGYVGTLTDITKLHEAEARLRETQIEIAHYARVNAIGEMASGIAHELNQPLTVIANYANGCIRRLQNTDVSSEIVGSIRQIAEQAERAGAIIHHLKDFLRKGTPGTVACDLNQCVKNVISIMQSMAKNFNISLQNLLDPNLPIVAADDISIEQVLVNLISNAIEALAELEQDEKRVLISSYQQSNSVVLTVEDNGTGVPDTIVEKMFTPFMTTKTQGMGIGLSLSKNLLERHNAHLTYEHLPNGGAKFIITLPNQQKLK
ncbi:MAG: PAS domain S-box protein [Gammaproteobacteria bacterium]|nr:PAS domain S-box protein [Gammaproteobacteria bacterium]